jgi:transcriptional regulator with XRE-family HTH domain
MACNIMKIESAQIRAARALLDWSGPRLAEASGVSLATIRRAEQGNAMSPLVARALREALERAGVRFIAEEWDSGVGVRLAKPLGSPGQGDCGQ